MSLYTEYLTPVSIGDASLSEQKGLPVYGDSQEWVTRQSKKARGSLHVTPSPEPLDRHDFFPRHGYSRQEWLDTTASGCSPVNAFLTALTMGRNNHHRQLQKLGADLAVRRLTRALTDSLGPHTNDAFSLAEVLKAAADSGLVRNFWRVTNYDQLICRIATTGPVLVTLPWYDHFISEETLETRAETPWGNSLGFTSMVVSAYSANGMLLRLQHFELWKRPSFQILEDDFVELMNEGGELFAFDAARLSDRVLPFYRVHK